MSTALHRGNAVAFINACSFVLVGKKNVTGSSREAGAAAELAASRKEEKLPALGVPVCTHRGRNL